MLICTVNEVEPKKAGVCQHNWSCKLKALKAAPRASGPEVSPIKVLELVKAGEDYLLKHPEETWAERLAGLEKLVVDHHPLWKEICSEISKAHKSVIRVITSL